MAMKLTALAGPRRGDTFPIPEGVFTIGRSRANALALEMDFRVSRHHCVVERLGEQCTIRDLESHNRTRVNDVEIGDGRLSHGDEIQIGESVFAFLVDGQPPPRPRARIDLDDGDEVPGSTVTIGPGNAAYIGPDAVLTAIADGLPAPRAVVASTSGRPTADRMSRVMKSVIRVCRAATSGKGLTDLQRRVLESVMEGVPAGRAAILLGGGSTDELTSAVHWTCSGGEAPSFRIPRRVVQGVLEDRAAVCINDALNDSLKPSPTMLEAEIGALMAVAVVAADTVIGALYVDASDPEARFSEDDLHLLLAIADVSAVPLANALRTERLERENERLLGQIAGDHPLLGASDRMRSVHRFITKVADSDSTVLIAGASGTGKELVARAIHRLSGRAKKPFVAVNCAAVAESLLESEFFGHEKGAFTSAYVQKKGKLEEANGGTVFLDEIGELALPLQAKLLRVLQEREFDRVGGSGTRPIRINIRVIAATNRDLAQEITRGAFRQDLYFRLNVVSLTMPELRERRDDIPLLAAHFLEKHAHACTRRVTSISDETLSCLMNYDWPGNVRELENAIERAIVLGSAEQIVPDDLPESIVESGIVESAAGAKFYERIKDLKRQLVANALDQTGGSYTEAARRLGLHPNNLHRLMKTLSMK